MTDAFGFASTFVIVGVGALTGAVGYVAGSRGKRPRLFGPLDDYSRAL